MDLRKIINGVQKVLDAAEEMTPVVKVLGGPTIDNVATLINAGSSIVNNVLDRINDASIVVATRDENLLRAMASELGEANDKLNKAIEES